MSKRRASGEGNIRKRSDGRWEGRYVAGHDANGKAIRKSVLAKTQAEVRDKLRRAIETSRVLDVARSEEYTVEGWVKTWYEVYSKPNLRESTQERYLNHIRYHIVPEIGHIKLAKLNGRDVQLMYNRVREHGRINHIETKGKSLSASYIHSLHRMLKMCLDRAVRERLIPFNPCSECVLPRAEKKEMKILKQEYVAAFLEEAKRRDVLPMFFLELSSGLRKGELIALLWSDLDIERRTISVSKQAARVKGGGVKILAPKTATSVRIESIPQRAVDLLIAEHEKHPENPYMFPSPKTGGMYYPDAISRLTTKMLKSAGLEHIRFHDLRHTFATMALQNGVDIRTVSGMLGHSDPGFTLRTYTHATSQMQEKAAQAVGDALVQHL